MLEYEMGIEDGKCLNIVLLCQLPPSILTACQSRQQPQPKDPKPKIEEPSTQKKSYGNFQRWLRLG